MLNLRRKAAAPAALVPAARSGELGRLLDERDDIQARIGRIDTQIAADRRDIAALPSADVETSDPDTRRKASILRTATNQDIADLERARGPLVQRLNQILPTIGSIARAITLVQDERRAALARRDRLQTGADAYRACLLALDAVCSEVAALDQGAAGDIRTAYQKVNARITQIAEAETNLARIDARLAQMGAACVEEGYDAETRRAIAENQQRAAVEQVLAGKLVKHGVVQP
jgi:chromosome segregation ATPase